MAQKSRRYRGARRCIGRGGTDKATMELESYQEGVLLHIGVEEGPVPVNGLLAIIGEKGEDFQQLLQEAQANGGSSTAAGETPDSAANNTEAAAPEHSVSSVSDSNERIKASPLARSIAGEAGIDLSNVKGTGDQGRIIKRDVEALLGTGTAPATAPTPAQPAKEAPAAPAFVPATQPGTYEDIPVSQMRKTIARRLGEANSRLLTSTSRSKSIWTRPSNHGSNSMRSHRSKFPSMT